MGKGRDRAPPGARVEVRLGGKRGLAVDGTIAPAGLWAVAGVVAAALLGSAAIVRAARAPRPSPRWEGRAALPLARRKMLPRLDHRSDMGGG